MGAEFQFVELIKTLLGHHGYFSYGWYVYFYLLLLITLPIISKLLNFNKWLAVVISYFPFIGAYIVLNRFQSHIPHYDIICILLFAYATACIGYTFAKHDFLSLMFKIFKEKKWLTLLVCGLIGLGAQILVFGYLGKGIIQPFSVVPIIIFLITLFSFNMPSWISKPLDLLGKNSMNMWYIHYIFFCPFIIYYIKSDYWILFSKIGIIAVIFAILISLVISIPFSFIDNKFIRKISFTKDK